MQQHDNDTLGPIAHCTWTGRRSNTKALDTAKNSSHYPVLMNRYQLGSCKVFSWATDLHGSYNDDRRVSMSQRKDNWVEETTLNIVPSPRLRRYQSGHTV